MKRLFRSSKNGTVDPLPPPPAAPTPIQLQPPPQQYPPQMIAQSPPPGGKRNGPLTNMIEIFDQPPRDQKAHYHEQKVKHGKSTVTPFPIDAGGQGGQIGAMSMPPTQPQAYAGHQSSQPVSAPRKGKERSSAPTLAEIQEQGLDMSRRDEWVAAQRGERAPVLKSGHRSRRQSKADAEPYMDDSTVVAPAQRHRGLPNGNDQPYQTSPMIPTPVPRPTGLPPQPHPSQSHPSHSNDLFLPPGARPPSPQQRSTTPTRTPASLPSQGVYGDHDDLEVPRPRHRSRAESAASLAASTRSSEHDGSRDTHGQSLSTSHGRSQGGHSAASHGVPGKMTKFPSPAHPSHAARSPLANAYATTEPDQTAYAHAGQPNLYAQQYPTPLGSESNLVEPPSQQMRDLRVDDAQPQGKEKEKKKFWGMPVGWAGEKGRKKELESEGMERRGSVDAWREDVQHTSSHGHGDHSSHGHGQEDGPWSRMLGIDSGRGRGEDKRPDHHNVETVSQAIHLLVAIPDPPFASAYEVCDRINSSGNVEAVGKEAARAIRKTFKSGNEGERRAAAKIWLIMMRNVDAKGFRAHGANKKLLGALEPILLPKPNQPLVNIQTHRMMLDVLGDLTYLYGTEKNCEGLSELWKKVKMPQESDIGVPLPDDHPLITPDNFFAPIQRPAFEAYPNSRRGSSPSLHHLDARNAQRGLSPNMYGGPNYAALPDHSEDVRRLRDECIAAKESARVLQEALVFTRPDELDGKPIIKEFYQKCVLAHESLTSQMDWAQAEATRSRERALSSTGHDSSESGEVTAEEQALAALFEAHGMLSEGLKHYHDLEALARDEREMKEVRERSKKETRIDRATIESGNMSSSGLMPPNAEASSSRSPSPVPAARLPPVQSSPRAHDAPLPHSNNPFRAHMIPSRSRTPSPSREGRLSSSPGLISSPLRQAVRAARPLPVPRTHSQQNVMSEVTSTNPSRSGTASTDAFALAPVGLGMDEDDAPKKPSRKALGKRRAVVDEDNTFNPDDMFLENSRRQTPESSEESVTADEVYNQRPVKYAYDAYQEKLDMEDAERRIGGSGVGGSGSGSGSRMVNALEGRRGEMAEV